MDRVLSMRLYVSDIALWTAVNQVTYEHSLSAIRMTMAKA